MSSDTTVGPFRGSVPQGATLGAARGAVSSDTVIGAVRNGPPALIGGNWTPSLTGPGLVWTAAVPVTSFAPRGTSAWA